MSRPSRDEWGLALARVVATRSTCLRRSVGCVLVDAKGRVLSTGYNGVAAGAPHCNEIGTKSLVELALGGPIVPGVPLIGHRDVYPNACPGAGAPSGTDLDACGAIHAEANALLQCRDVDAIDTAYVTCSPCVSCAKLLLGTGARRIVFAEEYPAPAARELWERAGRAWISAKKGAAPR